MEQPSLSSSRAVVVYLFLYCLVSSSLLFGISGAHAYVKQVANGTGELLIKRLSPSSNLDFMELLFPESHFNCEGVVNFTQKRGFIKSPNYPNGYTVPLFCRWNIVGAVDEIITISLTLIDIEIPSESPIHCYRTAEFQASLCCARNYLKITSSGGGGSYSSVGGPSSSRARDQSQQQQQQQLYCGDSSLQWQTYTSTSNVVAVEFNALDNYAHARGFYLEYSIHPRRSAALDASSATSGDDSAVCPEGKFQCATSKLCIDAERRCNGVADCDHHHIDQDESHPNSSPHVPDFSDELNCTSQLCRPEKGAFLCSDGRCILSPWSCDQDCSDEKGNGGPGTVGCMKNSVITAAIIGSLVCLLLIVIAISCAIRLFGLRHSGHYRSSLLATGRSASPTSAAAAAAGHHGHGHHHHHHHLPPFADSVLPFPPLMSTGDLDASLFRLDHSVFLREPPPSYASTMGGYADVPAAGAGGVNGLGVGGSASASYMEQYRRYRRQRRCRRLLRRQQRMAAGGGGGGGAATAGTAAQSAGDVGTCTSPPPIDEETLAHHRQPRYHHHHQGHQFVNPLPLSPTAAAAADISLRGTAHHHHHHQFASVVGLRINPIIPSDSSAAVGLPALSSSGAFNGGSSATTATTLPPPSQPPPSFQANILQQESCFDVGGGTSSSSTSKMKKKGGTSLTTTSSSSSSDLNHLNTQCNSSPGGVASTTFGVLPFSSASSSAASTSAASSAGAVDAATALTIELEPIPPLLTNFDCDSLPLIR